jgi:hypothetical protein
MNFYVGLRLATKAISSTLMIKELEKLVEHFIKINLRELNEEEKYYLFDVIFYI